MTSLEERLRSELPLLADALKAVEPQEPETPLPVAGDGETVRVLEVPMSDRRGGRAWSLVVGAAALVAVIVVTLLVRDSDRASDLAVGAGAGVDRPSSFGSWSVLPEAPIDSRPYAVTAWTGDEAVFWAGSSLSRDFAYVDGAAYAPSTRSWRELPVPGWGHPGLTSAFFDGDLYALAKGSGSRFDPVGGIWSDLPAVEGMLLAATVATDDAVWGLGPAGENASGQPDIAIARYQPETDSWDYGSVFEGTAEQAAVVSGLARLESSVHWNGSEIIVWGGAVGGLAFDPATGKWRALEHPVPEIGVVRASVAVSTDVGLGVLARIDTPDGSVTSLAILDDGNWTWRAGSLPIADFDAVTLAAAEDWLIVFSADGPPTTIHVPSGAWFRHHDGPLGGVRAPNTVWTGEELVVWGGRPVDADTPETVSWTPPSG